MILKDLMEEKQLNLNQPLLSVRRFSSTVASETDYKSKTGSSLAGLPLAPAYKSELKSVPVRNAGTVPFVWEKAPGRPKDESKIHTKSIEDPLIITPNFPPGRVQKTKRKSLSDMRSGSTLSNSKSIASLKKKVENYSKEETKGKESDSDDEAFEDALDTLSRTESFFMSCSVSGLSGWDEQEVQPCGSFSSDFMIDRFLLAAKAMTSEPPQYASKKRLVGQEHQKQKKKEENTESSCPLNHHRLKALPHYSRDIDREESDDCIESENYANTTCGRFPRFCLLNPISGLRMIDKVQRNAAHGMQAKSSASYTGSTKEQATTPLGKTLVDSQPGFISEEKEILDILVKSKHGTGPHQRGHSKLVSCESTQQDEIHVEKTLYVDFVQKVKSQTNNTGSDFETLRIDSGIYNNPSIDSEKQALKKLDNQGIDLHQDMAVTSSPKVVECKKLNSESQVHSRDKNSNILTQNSELDLKCQVAAKWVDQECTLSSTKMRNDGKIDLESQCITKLGHKEIFGASCFGLPSLKAPSESWLKRTLPTISKKNMMTSQSNNLFANIHARSKNPKTTTSLYPKWETIVKSSNAHAHHGHLQLRKELQIPIPEA